MLRGLCTWMYKRKYAAKLDFTPETPKGQHNIKPIPHPADLINAINSLKLEHHRIIMLLMLYTGMRWNEAASIRWADVDLKGRTIRIRETDSDQDFCYLPEPLLEWFTQHKKKSGFVFQGRLPNKPCTRYVKAFDEVSKALGCKFTSHSLRHASATYLYERTGDIYQVQAHLRHKKLTTTLIYARMSVSRRKSAINSISDYINEKSSQNTISK